jgi:hypothetical protein
MSRLRQVIAGAIAAGGRIETSLVFQVFKSRKLQKPPVEFCTGRDDEDREPERSALRAHRGRSTWVSAGHDY